MLFGAHFGLPVFSINRWNTMPRTRTLVDRVADDSCGKIDNLIVRRLTGEEQWFFINVRGVNWPTR